MVSQPSAIATYPIAKTASPLLKLQPCTHPLRAQSWSFSICRTFACQPSKGSALLEPRSLASTPQAKFAQFFRTPPPTPPAIPMFYRLLLANISPLNCAHTYSPDTHDTHRYAFSFQYYPPPHIPTSTALCEFRTPSLRNSLSGFNLQTTTPVHVDEWGWDGRRGVFFSLFLLSDCCKIYAYGLGGGDDSTASCDTK